MEIVDLINDIWRVYNEITEDWNKIKPFDFNQKNITIKVADSKPEIYKLACDYRDFLFERSTKIQSSFNFNIEVRVKNRNSMDDKIQRYIKTPEHEYGNIPFKKCLNDLMGLRYVDNFNSIKFEDVKKVVDNLPYHNLLRIINKNDDKYKAVHIYFRKDNRDFRWELQLWNKEDEKNNKEQHEAYKQNYTKTENEYKDEKKQRII